MGAGKKSLSLSETEYSEMVRSRLIQFFNENSDLPLLKSYFCSFERPDGSSVSLASLLPETALLFVDVGQEFNVTLMLDGRLQVCSENISSAIANGHVRRSQVSVDGDVILVLWHFEDGPSIRIPFVNGIVVSDNNQWSYTNPPVYAQVIKPVPSGYLVSVEDDQGFLPEALAKDVIVDGEGIVMKVFRCEVIASDGHYPVIVKPTGPFREFGPHMYDDP